MKLYFLRRILAMIPMFFLMTGVYFVVNNYLPGGPVQEAMQRLRGSDEGGKGGARLNSEDMVKLRKDLERQYGLDKPIPVRYWNWLKNVVVFEFGDSSATRRPAIETIMERVPISLGFGIPGFFLTYLICIFLGVSKALKDGSLYDYATSINLFIAYSIPAVVISVVLLLVFCTDRVLTAPLFPLGGARSDDYAMMTVTQKMWDYARHMFLPVFASMIGGFTTLTLLTKSSMLDVLQSDFVRTARAKGLSENRVIYKHALRNAILPLMVGIGGFLGAFVAGSIIIESVFNLPGMGLLMIEALQSRDYNVLMGVAVIQSLIIMVGQLVSDLAYVLVDPRIDFK
jgi:microcin C transport system permease protein